MFNSGESEEDSPIPYHALKFRKGQHSVAIGVQNAEHCLHIAVFLLYLKEIDIFLGKFFAEHCVFVNDLFIFWKSSFSVHIAHWVREFEFLFVSFLYKFDWNIVSKVRNSLMKKFREILVTNHFAEFVSFESVIRTSE